MRKSSLAFITFAFVIYWLWTSEHSSDRQAALDPVVPSLVRMLPLPSKSQSPGIRQWLANEALRAENIAGSPNSNELRLKEKALALKSSDLETLKTVALSPSASGNERYLAVYIIGLSGNAGARGLLSAIENGTDPAVARHARYWLTRLQ